MSETIGTTESPTGVMSFMMCNCGEPHPHGYLVLDGSLEKKLPIIISSRTIGLKVLEMVVCTDEEKEQVKSQLQESGLPEVLVNREQDESYAEVEMMFLFFSR